MLRFAIVATALLSLITVAGATVASAADLRRPPPMQPAPMLAPPPGWTGFYIGANAGGGWGRGGSDFTFGTVPFASIDNNLSGFIGGGQAGYNWQMGWAVLGVEADIQYSGMTGALTSPGCPAAVCGVALGATYKQDVTWFGTARGRLGFADAGWMAYLTGGYAYAQLETEAVATAGAVIATVRGSEMKSGWTLGGGIEVMLWPNWSARVEYLHLDFGRDTTNLAFIGLPDFSDSSTLSMEVVRAGINYRF